MHGACELHVWFIFNLHTKILLYLKIIHCNIYKITAFPPNPTPCILINHPHFTYLESQLLCSWWWMPIHPCLWSANNCSTPWLLSLSPFHTPQFKLYYLHKRHQQSRSSWSGTVSVLFRGRICMAGLLLRMISVLLVHVQMLVIL